MIHPQDAGPTNQSPGVAVVDREGSLDLERFAAVLAKLEFYVDELLFANDLPAMDPWVDDEVTEVRLASL